MRRYIVCQSFHMGPPCIHHQTQPAPSFPSPPPGDIAAAVPFSEPVRAPGAVTAAEEENVARRDTGITHLEPESVVIHLKKKGQ